MSETTTNTEVEAPEVWHLDGRPFHLHVRDLDAEMAAYYAANPDEEDYGDDGWFPESPGERPPVAYKLVPVDGVGDDHHYTVRGAYYCAYDDVAYMLVRDGWTPPPLTEAELATCEHGLSARLCAGPGHYPMDNDR